jgi:hypothetical protein
MTGQNCAFGDQEILCPDHCNWPNGSCERNPGFELTRDQKIALLRAPIRINIVGRHSWGGRSTQAQGSVPRPSGMTFDESYYHTPRDWSDD